jgi:hypothetical protein
MTRRTLLIGFVIFGGALVVAACSDGDRPAPVGSSSGTPVDGGPGGPDSTTEDAAVVDPAVHAGLCEGAPQSTTAVAEVGVEGNAPPALGGEISPGTYILAEMNVYGAQVPKPDAGDETPGPGLSGVVGRGTLNVFATGVLRIASARGNDANNLPPEKTDGFLFTKNGTSLDVTPVCPATGPKKALPYSAVGNGIALFVDATHRELYVRQ